MNATLARTREEVAEEIYKECAPGEHVWMNFGLEEHGLEQCLKCGKVRCTIPLDDEDPPGRYGL